MATTALLDHSARRPQAAVPNHVSPLVRLRVALDRIRLVEALAAGADPSGSPELALRARQITSPREIATCITGVERILRDAATPPRGLTAEAPLQREAILAARPFLLNLLAGLQETKRPRPAGVARTVLLLSDGCGPVYTPSPPGTLASRAYRAAQGL
jgi:hypothetical protein